MKTLQKFVRDGLASGGLLSVGAYRKWYETNPGPSAALIRGRFNWQETIRDIGLKIEQELKTNLREDNLNPTNPKSEH